jgi:hypothetical protein
MLNSNFLKNKLTTLLITQFYYFYTLKLKINTNPEVSGRF